MFITRYCDVYKPCCVAAGLPGDGDGVPGAVRQRRVAAGDLQRHGGRSHCLSGLQADLRPAGLLRGRPRAALDVRPGLRWRGRHVHSGQRLPGAGRRATRDACPVSRTARTSASVRPRSAARSVARRASAACAAASLSTAGRPATSPTWAISATRTTACAATASGACVALADVGATCELSSDCGETAFCDANTGTCAARKPVGAACIDQALECADGCVLRRGRADCARRSSTSAAPAQPRAVPDRQLPERHLPADPADRREPALRGVTTPRSKATSLCERPPVTRSRI